MKERQTAQQPYEKKDISSVSATDQPSDYLTREHSRWQETWRKQPPIIQRFIEAQAQKLAEAVHQKQSQVRFTLPDKVLDIDGQKLIVPNDQRDQVAGGLIGQFTRASLADSLHLRLEDLEASSLPGVNVSAGLIRYITSRHMVHNMLPEGRSVEYRSLENEEIPTIPVERADERASALTETTDAIVEESNQNDSGMRGELLVPFVPAARRFYLPQWIAFDNQDHLLVNSFQEAEAYLQSMQNYLGILHTAVSLAPYMVIDEVYQQKRYGILGQLVNQGRALARYETRDVIEIIQHRANTNDLNRGLSLSLPYFDDQDLVLKTLNFEVIPAGRIMFVPAFVVRAARLEQAKVAQDTRLSPSTRNHLLAELRSLEQAFLNT
jgi:hypothetical protein